MNAIEPVTLPGSNNPDMTDHVSAIALRSKAFLWWWIAVAPAALLTSILVGSILYLFYAGVGIWGIDWPVAWGFAIISYVWWIAIASGGTFISALFFLTRSEWRNSINRIAESMTLFGAACAGIYPILHLGRPWFFYWLFPYPNSMGLWPQFRSPLLWDFFAILTYVTASVLFWYLGLLPDLATLRDRAPTRTKQVVYGAMALGFRGTSGQWRHYHALYGVLAAIMAPLVCSVHSIVGLDFAGAATVGWHSTMFPPFFIFGAFLSGFATVLLLIMPLRRLLRLQRYITTRHVEVLGRLLLTSSLFVGYAYIMDAFTTYYGGEKAEITMFQEKLFGYYAGIYWATILFNVLLPQLLWFRTIRLNQLVVGLISVGVIVGMWCERYTIVVVS
ncbi:MAG TPA: NrfD/PsrC family molybdoenzyme membrane anchor subunit, partial [Acetobacteraceae bacterium]|nr:NrfD/PsrC family molybdoenzyme membrane anchor subunit [Acetobacteraceae bacterium]